MDAPNLSADDSSSGDDSSVVKSSSSEPSSTQYHVQKSDATALSLTHRETKAVNRSKVLVYVALLVAAVGVATVGYFLSHQAEVDDFNTAFVKFADDVAAAANSNADNLFGVVRSLSTAITSYSQEHGSSWPNITLPNFDRRASDARVLAGLKFLAFAPLVTTNNMEAWEEYAFESQGWIAKDWSYRKDPIDPGPISPEIYYTGLDGEETEVNENELDAVHFPLWQAGPVPHNATVVNFDLYQHPEFRDKFNDAIEARKLMISGVVDIKNLLERIVFEDHDEDLHTVLFEPVYADFTEDANVTGFILAGLPWEYVLGDILPTGTNGILVQVSITCGSSFTYMLNGRKPELVGEGLLGGNSDQAKHMRSYPFAERTRFYADNEEFHDCFYTLQVLPTEEFEQAYISYDPIVFAFIIVFIFMVTACVFAVYDYMVYKRQAKLLDTAERTSAIVSSLFPKDVRDRIMADANAQARLASANQAKPFGATARSQLKGFLTNDNDHDDKASTFMTKPIADLFPEVTVMFADLVGFTAWSSTREPAHVFTLLETIFNEFDQIAKQRRVFKVETVGDCYVAAAGLPEPQATHATIMARFARDCLYKMHALVRQLEISLGPDTADLGLRFGLHSGPVTAGVLRGERARFQLFGDTMNTTARIETSGAKNRIHISHTTAELLVKAGKGHWVRARDEKVHAKGKGELTTFWLDVKGDIEKSRSSGTSSTSGNDHESNTDAAITKAFQDKNDVAPTNATFDDKTVRLVGWNAEIISKILKEIVARREALRLQPDSDFVLGQLETGSLLRDSIVLDECADVMELPTFQAACNKQRPAETVQLDAAITDQLHEYIRMVAALYRENPFHNFEHASHVTMSVTKLLSRIVAPDIQVTGKDDVECDKILHDHTYGITSSPLTQFAIILSALVHDVDHTGVPNSQLIQEQASIAAAYKNKSVAEQNSIDIAWDLLMQDTFKGLRRTIYQTKEEFSRFRQLLVNTVMATDIMDKELSAKRKERWLLAFAESTAYSESDQQLIARKATIVIEHLIQASDVVHTMQHWHVYRKWNQRLYFELFKAFKEGRAEDPTANWYKGEMGFFDFYVIPLAKKLKDCGVFGVSSDEYLNYAQQNRREWEIKGEENVAEMKEQADSTFGNLVSM